MTSDTIITRRPGTENLEPRLRLQRFFVERHYWEDTTVPSPLFVTKSELSNWADPEHPHRLASLITYIFGGNRRASPNVENRIIKAITTKIADLNIRTQLIDELKEIVAALQRLNPSPSLEKARKRSSVTANAEHPTTSVTPDEADDSRSIQLSIERYQQLCTRIVIDLKEAAREMLATRLGFEKDVIAKLESSLPIAQRMIDFLNGARGAVQIGLPILTKQIGVEPGDAISLACAAISILNPMVRMPVAEITSLPPVPRQTYDKAPMLFLYELRVAAFNFLTINCGEAMELPDHPELLEAMTTDPIKARLIAKFLDILPDIDDDYIELLMAFDMREPGEPANRLIIPSKIIDDISKMGNAALRQEIRLQALIRVVQYVRFYETEGDTPEAGLVFAEKLTTDSKYNELICSFLRLTNELAKNNIEPYPVAFVQTHAEGINGVDGGRKITNTAIAALWVLQPPRIVARLDTPPAGPEPTAPPRGSRSPVRLGIPQERLTAHEIN